MKKNLTISLLLKWLLLEPKMSIVPIGASHVKSWIIKMIFSFLDVFLEKKICDHVIVIACSCVKSKRRFVNKQLKIHLS